MVDSEIAGNFPNQNNNQFATVAKGGFHDHHGQASPSTHHSNGHEDNGHQPSNKGENPEHD